MERRAIRRAYYANSGYSPGYDAFASADYGASDDTYMLHGAYISESEAVRYCAQTFRSYDIGRPMVSGAQRPASVLPAIDQSNSSPATFGTVWMAWSSCHPLLRVQGRNAITPAKYERPCFSCGSKASNLARLKHFSVGEVLDSLVSAHKPILPAAVIETITSAGRDPPGARNAQSDAVAVTLGNANALSLLTMGAAPMDNGASKSIASNNKSHQMQAF